MNSATKELNKQICLNKYLLLNSISFKEGYFVLLDNDDSEIVIRSKAGGIYFPKCVKIDRIKILPHVTTCHNEIEVLFIIGNRSTNGFIGHNNVITKCSQQVDCADKSVVNTIGNEFIIIREKNESKIITQNNGINTWNRLIKVRDHNFPHMIDVLSEIDIFLEIERNSPEKNRFYTEKKSLKENIKYENIINILREEITSNIKNKFIITMIIAVVILSIGIVYFSSKNSNM